MVVTGIVHRTLKVLDYCLHKQKAEIQTQRALPFMMKKQLTDLPNIPHHAFLGGSSGLQGYALFFGVANG